MSTWTLRVGDTLEWRNPLNAVSKGITDDVRQTTLVVSQAVLYAAEDKAACVHYCSHGLTTLALQ